MLTRIVGSVALLALFGQQQPPTVRSIKPNEIQWSQHPALPAGAMKAVVYGDNAKPGPYVNRLRTTPGLKVLPHTHPDDRIYTVLSGTLYMGYGDTWDQSKLVAYPAGTVIFLPANVSHYQYGAYEIQVNGMGPTDLTFINPADDLRKKK